MPLNWSIEQTGDFSADGYADILWRDTTTGAVAMWFPGVSSTGAVATVGTDWKIQGLNSN